MEILYQIHPYELDQFCESNPKIYQICQDEYFLRKYLKIYKIQGSLSEKIQNSIYYRSILLLDYLVTTNDISVLSDINKAHIFGTAGFIGNINIITYLMDHIPYDKRLYRVLHSMIELHSNINNKELIRIVI